MNSDFAQLKWAVHNSLLNLTVPSVNISRQTKRQFGIFPFRATVLVFTISDTNKTLS